jgi:hypothetical protein
MLGEPQRQNSAVLFTNNSGTPLANLPDQPEPAIEG